MTIEKKNVSSCVVELSIKAEKAEFKPAYDKVEKEYFKNASLPGFRKGKIPASLIRTKFASAIKRDATEEIFQDLVKKAVAQEKIDFLAVTGIDNVELTEESFSVTCKIDVRPEIKLPKYTGLAVEKVDTTVTDEQIESHIASYRKMNAKYEMAKEGDIVEKGDFVTFSFSGVMNDKAKTPVKDVVPEEVAKNFAEREFFWVSAGEEDEKGIPGFADAVLGMKAGETKEDIKVKFGKDVDASIAGKTVLYTIKIDSFRKCFPPTDEDIIKEIPDVNTMDEFRALLRKTMEDNKKAQAKRVQEDSIIESLLKAKGADFEVPQSQVYEAQVSVYEKYVKSSRENGMSDADIEKAKKEMFDSAREFAEKQVRMAYLFAKIAEKENIEPTDEDVKKFVTENYEDKSADIDKVIEFMTQTGRINSVKSFIINQKVVEFLLSKAK